MTRKLMSLLEYGKWENINNVIKKSIIPYKNSNDFLYWPPEIRKPIISRKKEFILKYKLTKYLCYLIVQNVNLKKEKCSISSKIFFIQTRNAV